ncbi:hypothetical protein Taro_030662 [Colocasia esculenta]|uniref:Uncharacterized protein n=1 Tax=Colocasia esculenta TaxID=4460 RepID=A0A843VPS6_COLES|nr:hypothetical protein [Colocasia esculenta]
MEDEAREPPGKPPFPSHSLPQPQSPPPTPAGFIASPPPRSVEPAVEVPPGASPGSSFCEDDLFEPVSLRDLERGVPPDPDPNAAVGSVRSSNSEEMSRSPGNDAGADVFAMAAAELDAALDSDGRSDRASYPSSPGPAMKPSSSSASFDSYFSPVITPLKTRTRFAMPSVPPELLHLVDSAIMGSAESLQRLKDLISSPGGFDDMSRSVVDVILATIGVDSFDESASSRDGVSAPSVMLNSRAAVVAAELIPSLPWEGDLDNWMSPRTRIVRGLLLTLRACTRNRAMCSAAGLLRVLLVCAEKLSDEFTGETHWDAAPLCQCIHVLGGHSLSVLDLYRWLDVIKGALGTDWATWLMLALEKAVARNALLPLDFHVCTEDPVRYSAKFMSLFANVQQNLSGP